MVSRTRECGSFNEARMVRLAVGTAAPGFGRRLRSRGPQLPSRMGR
jgi:hypothetical protein